MTSPFSTSTFTYPGQATTRFRALAPVKRPFWIGTPGAMIQLPAPTVGYEADQTRAEVVHALMSGGTGVTKHRFTKRSWTIQWAYLASRDLQVVRGMYRGLFTDGPFCFVAPEDVNRLPIDTGLSGTAFLGLWTVGAGTVALDPTTAARIAPGGTVKWLTPGNGSYLFAGTQPSAVFTPSSTLSAPYVPDQAWTFTCWLKTASSTGTAQVDLLGVPAAGTASPVVASASAAVTTTWTQFTVTVAAGASGWSQSATPYIVPAVKCAQTSMPTLYVSNPQLEYGVSTPSNWEAGDGVPQVVISAPQTRAVDAVWASEVSLVLSEV